LPFSRLYLLRISRKELHLSFLCCAKTFYGLRYCKDFLTSAKSTTSDVIKLIEHAIGANGFPFNQFIIADSVSIRQYSFKGELGFNKIKLIANVLLRVKSE